MFDVRPVDKDGNLDLGKINKLGARRRKNFQTTSGASITRAGRVFEDMRRLTPQEEELRRFQRAIKAEKEKSLPGKKRAEQERRLAEIFKQKEKSSELEARKKDLLAKRLRKKYEAKLARKLIIGKIKNRALVFGRALAILVATLFRALSYPGKKINLFFGAFIASVEEFFEIFIPKGRVYSGYQKRSVSRKSTFSFFAVATCVFCLVFGVGFFYRSLRIKSLALENGKIAYASLTQAKEGLTARDFEGAIFKFNEAYERFSIIQEDINSLGSVLVESSRFVPYLSKLSSGSHLSEAGKNISRIGTLSSEIMKTLDDLKNPLAGARDVSYLKIFQDSDKNLTEIAGQVAALESNLEMINLDDIPEEQRTRFVELKKGLPEINKFVASFSQEEKILSDVLGGNGPRKYLFLFQNNQEMRATGGFIGTYAVLDIFNGAVKSFFVDGIFNPDGQLREKVIPPAPIQKISAAWSLHDSNWFPDFPVSAEKASWFYEKTGGPTVDGVITMTPTVMQKLLEITGPIEMSDYGVTIDKDNFLENIQYEVEVDYDKEENQPKKILADLAPKILDRVFNAKNVSDLTKTLDVILTSLNEKHILIYSKNYTIEKMLSDNGWSGEVLSTQKDYLSVINTNINGYKTDGMIDEEIQHKAEIQLDGSIIDTVTITRHHNGGNTPYDWWNRVNADYLRVYVPKGSKLIRATGQTNEFNSPPIDYRALGFKRDAQVEMEEASTVIDEESGTRIYEDSGKTVFANWVYVSPQESVTVTYAYLLPFKLDTNLTVNSADTYSLLAQKQSGSIGSRFSTKIIYPDLYRAIWKYPNDEVFGFSVEGENSQGIELKSNLKIDKFIGVAFEKNNP
jgi:hypothetical protein